MLLVFSFLRWQALLDSLLFASSSLHDVYEQHHDLVHLA
jgi:hypothetical protein